MTNIVGKYTYGYKDISIIFPKRNRVIIGNFCSIGGNCKIYLNGDHHKEWITTYPFGYLNREVFTTFDGTDHPTGKGDVIIGNDVWIAENVTIMSGVKIGDGAIVANNSHVVKNVEPYSIVGGNPAKHISYRFNEDMIEKLLKIKWWDWEDSKINQYLPLLCSDNYDKFFELCDQK